MTENDFKTADYIDNIYFIEKMLGKGSQGKVYKVKSLLEPHKNLAMKMISIEGKNRKKTRSIERYIRSEFSLLRTLNHPNIVKVFDFGFDHKQHVFYFTMEYLEGMSLAQFFQQNNPDEYFAKITYQILLGLNYLHANRIIHYDINPGNIIIQNIKGEYVVKILDFGLAELNKLFSRPRFKWNMLYLAPEIIASSTNISEKIDLYSLGISLLFCISPYINVGENIRLLSSTNTIKRLTKKKTLNNKALLKRLRNRQNRIFLNSLIENNPKLRIDSAIEAINSLNIIFASGFDLPNISTTTSFVNNTKFLVHTRIVNLVINYLTNYISTSKTRFIYLSGEAGVGKSRIIEQIQFNLNILLKKTILLKQEDIGKGSPLEVVYNLINKLYFLTYSTSFINLDYLSKVLKKIKNIKENSSGVVSVFKEVIEFIKATTKEIEIIIILDDFEKYDKLSISFFSYLSEYISDTNCLIVATFNPDKITKNFLNRQSISKSMHHLEIIQIPRLSEKEVFFVRRSFLGEISKLPEDFDNQLYFKTNGNFRRLMESFDNLVNSKILKCNSKGKFSFTYEKQFQSFIRNYNFINNFYLRSNLTKNENTVYDLLLFSLKDLSEEEINLLTQNERLTTRQTIYSLIKKGLVKIVKVIKNDLSIEIYQPISYTFRFQALKKLKTESLTKIFKTLFYRTIDLKLDPELNALYSYLINGKNHYEILHPDQYNSLLESGRDRELKLFFLKIVEKYLENFLNIDNKNKESIYNLLKELLLFKGELKNLAGDYKGLEEIIKKVKKLIRLQKKSGISQGVWELRLFNLQVEYNFGLNQHLKNFNLTKKYKSQIFSYLKTNKYYNIFRRFIELEDFYTKKDKVNELLNFTKAYLGLHFDYLFYLYYKVIKTSVNLIEKPEDDITEISDLLDKLIKSSEYQKNIIFFDIYFKFYELAKHIDKKRKKLTEEKGLKYLKLLASKAKENNFLKIYSKYNNAIAGYYYRNKESKRALGYMEKAFKGSSSAENDYHIILRINLENLKLELMKNLASVIKKTKELIEDCLVADRIKYLAVLYTNLARYYFLHGNMTFSAENTYKALKFLKFSSYKENILQVLINYFPFYFLEEEAENKLEELARTKIINQELFEKCKTKFRKMIISIKERKNFLEKNKAQGMWTVSEINTPGIILNYIKSHQTLPSEDFMKEKFAEKSGNSIEHKILSDINEFMLTQNKDKLNVIAQSLKRLFVLGYITDIFIFLTPLLEYLYIFKIKDKEVVNLISLYRDTIGYLNSNIHKDIKKRFENLFEYKRGRKAYYRLTRILEK